MRGGRGSDERGGAGVGGIGRVPDLDGKVARARAVGGVDGTDTYDFNRGLGLAHMDAVLRGNEEAAAFLAGDLPSVFSSRGIRVSIA